MPTIASPTLLHPHTGGQSGSKRKLYNPRHPERTLLYQTIAEHFETWHALSSAGQFEGQGDHHTPRPFVRQAFRKYLECGRLNHGFDMLAYQHSGFSVDAGVCIESHDRAALVPPPRTHRHRYFGVLAPNSPLRAAVTALATPAQPTTVQGAPTSTGECAPGAVPLGSALPVGGADRPHL